MELSYESIYQEFAKLFLEKDLYVLKENNHFFLKDCAGFLTKEGGYSSKPSKEENISLCNELGEITLESINDAYKRVIDFYQEVEIRTVHDFEDFLKFRTLYLKNPI